MSELLVETARLWRSLGHNDAAGQFRIDRATGPDEYSVIAWVARCHLGDADPL
jgi:alpha,alpha-trehalose phosphorylase